MFIVIDIGCIECGEDTNLAGVFDSEGEADIVADKLDNLPWRGGEHSYEVFEVSDDRGLDERYQKMLDEN
jgi:hypothetical protein